MAEAPEESATPPPLPPPPTEQDNADPMQSLCGTGGNWWGGWIQAAKDKSASAIEFVKKDIEEFKSTMQSDSETIKCTVRGRLNQETATAATQKVKQGMSYLLEGIKTALIIPPEDMSDDEGEPITVHTSQHIFDRAKARLHAVQIDPGTYCEEPSGSKEEYEAWKADFNLEQKKGDISELLVANVEVRALYTQMVPSSVSHADFWQRYFYKIYQLDQEEQRRADLMKRANVVQADEDLAWDDEDDWENMEMGSSPTHQEGVERSSKREESDPDSKTPEELTDRLQPEIQQAEAEATTTDDNKHSQQTLPQQPEEKPSVEVTSDIQSLSDSSLSTTTSGSKDNVKDFSAESLTIVSPESAASDIPEEAGLSDQSLKTKEKGDLVVVGEGTTTSSERTSPASSDSRNKGVCEDEEESLDEDWEKDFDIEVTEEELKVAEDTTKDLPADTADGDGDGDWESWE